jgi:hypothetical protein
MRELHRLLCEAFDLPEAVREKPDDPKAHLLGWAFPLQMRLLATSVVVSAALPLFQ